MSVAPLQRTQLTDLPRSKVSDVYEHFQSQGALTRLPTQHRGGAHGRARQSCRRGGGAARGGMARRRASSGGGGRHAQQDPLPPYHHQWLAPLCGDAGRLRALADELGGMVQKEKAASAAVTHVVGVEMEGEATGAGEGPGAQQQHTAALARALAGRLGARYLPFNADSAVGAGAEAGAGAREEEEGRVALLCCAWVHTGGRLEAAAQGLGRQGYRCVRAIMLGGWRASTRNGLMFCAYVSWAFSRPGQSPHSRIHTS